MVNWIKQFRGAKEAQRLAELKVSGWQKRAEEAETRERHARNAKVEAEYHAQAAMAFKDEVLFLRALVQELTKKNANA